MPDVNAYKWELYNLSEDYSQANDLAAKMPDKLKQMQALFVQEAKKYNVFPLDNSQFQRAITPRPSATAGQTVFTYSGEMPGIPTRQRAEHPEQVVHDHRRCRGPTGRRRRDDRHRGRTLGRVRAVPAQRQAGVRLQQPHARAVPLGRPAAARGRQAHDRVRLHSIDGPGIAKGGTGVLKVDGQEVATLTIPKTIPFLLPGDETFDVGVDTRTGVNDQDYQVPFRFNGKIDKLTFKLGPVQLTNEEHQIIQHALARARD